MTDAATLAAERERLEEIFSDHCYRGRKPPLNATLGVEFYEDATVLSLTIHFPRNVLTWRDDVPHLRAIRRPHEPAVVDEATIAARRERAARHLAVVAIDATSPFRSAGRR
jgi:hypothetical protein